MTTLWRGRKNIWSGTKNAKGPEKAQALRMTSFSRGLKISGRVQKRGKVEKVTGSQDDKGESGASIGFDDTEGSTAGPSTSLRSGRDDNSYFGMGCECPRKIVVLIKKSQALGMTQARVALPFVFDAARVNRRSLHFATLRSG